MHKPGECPESYYGKDCDGIAIYGPDPYAHDIAGDATPVWLCEGVRRGRAMDI